jgi:cellobiose phosphorylase
MYRLILESLLGIQVAGDTMRIVPLLPDAWPGFSVAYRYKSTMYQIEVLRSDRGRQGVWITCDGQLEESAHLVLRDDKLSHRVVVEVAPCGQSSATSELSSRRL